MLTLVLLGSVVALFPGSGEGAPQVQTAAYALAGNRLVVFDAASGQTLLDVAAPYGSGGPDLLADPAHHRLYVAGTGLGVDASQRLGSLILLDTRNWQVTARAQVPHRISYNGGGYGSMVLSPDGSRLLMYEGRGKGNGEEEDYWLAALNPRTLRAARQRVSLPECGSAELADARGLVAVLCHGTYDSPGNLRLLDARSMRVVARVRVQGYGLTIPVSQRFAFIGGTGVLTRVNLASRRATTVQFEMRAAWARVPLFDGVASAGDGTRLVVGLQHVSGDSSPTAAVQSFTLPRLSPDTIVDPAPQWHLVGGSDGTVLLFPMADSPPAAWQIVKLDIGSGSMSPLLVVPGPVARIVTAPGA
jgi:hypothetical protein